MITRDNIKEVVNSLDTSDLKRLRNTHKEYCVLYLFVYNAGFAVRMTLTNDYNRYQNVSNSGNCILECDEVIRLTDEA